MICPPATSSCAAWASDADICTHVSTVPRPAYVVPPESDFSLPNKILRPPRQLDGFTLLTLQVNSTAKNSIKGRSKSCSTLYGRCQRQRADVAGLIRVPNSAPFPASHLIRGLLSNAVQLDDHRFAQAPRVSMAL